MNMENRSFSPLVLAGAVLAAALVGFVGARSLGDAAPPTPVAAAPAERDVARGPVAADGVPAGLGEGGTEATVEPVDEPEAPAATAAPAAQPPVRTPTPTPAPLPARREARRTPAQVPAAAPAPAPTSSRPAAVADRQPSATRGQGDVVETASNETASAEPVWSRPFPAPEAAASLPDRTAPAIDAPPPPPQIKTVSLPADSVVGLRLETAVSTDTAQVEDTVHARVTRDVLAGGDVVIPAGTRVTGSVTFVDQGGKVRERARLGVRFHTLVLADGTEVRLPTETIYRDGESPSGRSAARIGGSAAAGAVIGAILGGGKGAAIGAAVGAGGGTAATMAGGRKPAMLPAGQTLTVRLSDQVDVAIPR